MISGPQPPTASLGDEWAPVVAPLLLHPMPIVWRMRTDPATGLRRSAGIAVPAHGPCGRFLALLLLEPESPAVLKDDAFRDSLMLFAWHLHARIRKVEANRPEQKKPALKKMERACLGLAARGCTSSEIAAALSIRERTVHFHIANANKALGARTRCQGVAKAVRFGIIDPCAS